MPAASTRVGYGNARELCLGLEVVLADGRVWNGLRRLRKDNTGYDLKDIFIGAEGTLGIITAAVLKMFPQPEEKAIAFCALPSPRSALDLLSLSSGGGKIAALEILPRLGLRIHDEAFRRARSVLYARTMVCAGRNLGCEGRKRRAHRLSRPGA